ncbi:MAG: FtsX-like permease family protein [Candidatus Dormiibacterota bacterium]
MWRLASHELRGQWRLTALLSFGLILAALAYVSLVGTASGTTTVLTGDIGKAWNTPYDLLVRPAGDVSKLESTKGLVSPNFISSISGGISEAQLASIRRIKNVTVAAPIAVVGYTTVDYTFNVPSVPSLLGSSSFAVLRVDEVATAEDGLANYPTAPTYIIWAPDGVLTTNSIFTSQLSYAGKTIQCNNTNVLCDAATVVCTDCAGPIGTFSPTETPAELAIPIPVMIAGIDPAAEAKLAGVKATLIKGHYLPLANKPLKVAGIETLIPVIVSSKSFISETVEVKADALADPEAVFSGKGLASLSGWSPVYKTSRSVQSLYSQLALTNVGLPSDLANVVIPGEIHYRELAPGRLQAKTMPTETKELLNPNCINCMADDVPPDASDTWYRQLKVSSRIASKYGFGFRVLGQYDPSKIPGFNVLAGGNLSAYAPPEALLPDGKPLLPSRNIASFITSPPLMLTTLAGAQYIADNFTNGPGPNFISVIRVRVAGTAKPSDTAQARLKAVAEAIERKTGLKVSLVKGSSALPIRVGLAKGKFGEPALTVTEYWGKEGAAITFLKGVNTESLVLFLLTVGVVTVLLAVVGQLAARRRRTDFGLLRAIGWPFGQVLRLALLEMALLGAVIGVATSVLAIGVSRVVEPEIPVLALLAVVPFVVVMSVLAPLPALLGAARSPAVASLKRRGALGKVRMRSVRSLALRDLLGPWRVESLLCVGASIIGSGLVGGVVLVVGGFTGTLGPTTLGRYLASQVGPLDIVMIVIAIIAGAGASATLLTLAYLERQVEFSTLRAIGWPRGAVATVVAIQALTLGVGGGVLAAVVVAAGGLAIGAPVVTAVAASLLAIAVAVVTAGIAMTGTISLAYRLLPAAALRST